jgi:hypothetical protein
METIFGAVFAFVLALGLWLNRELVAVEERPATFVFGATCE